MTRRVFVVAALCLLAFPLARPAPAEEALYGRVPRLFGAFTPVPGAWSEYEVFEKETGKRGKMRMSIVGKEGDAFWYEVINETPDGRNVIKMLVHDDPNDPENIERLILKSGDHPATEMPKDFVAMGRKMALHMFEKRSGVSAESASQLRVEKVEERTVSVSAGTFKATLQRIVDTDGSVLATYDFNPEVLPFGVIASNTKQTSMELLAYGKDARSVITETPALMSAPPGMPPGMPRGMPPGMGKPGPKTQ